MFPHAIAFLRYLICFAPLSGRLSSGYQPPSQPPPAQSGSGADQPSQMAWGALIAGILGWSALPLIASFAGVVMGKMELDKIKRGESPAAGKTIAQIGFWLSLVNIILAFVGTCLVLVVPVLFFGGFAAFMTAVGLAG